MRGFLALESLTLFASWLALHALAGRDVRPAAHLLFLYAQEKEAKESAPTSATPALRYGANLRRSTCGVRRRTHCALARSVQTTAASQSTKRVHAALHAPPRKRRAAGAASSNCVLKSSLLNEIFMLGQIPGGFISEHGVEDRQELAHASDDGHLLGLSRLHQALVEELEHGVVANG